MFVGIAAIIVGSKLDLMSVIVLGAIESILALIKTILDVIEWSKGDDDE